MFRLSTRSMSRLEGINPDLITVVTEAIKLTKVDFGVTCGMRTVEEQHKLIQQQRKLIEEKLNV